MSNIFAPYIRIHGGILLLNIGTGPIISRHA